MTCDGDCVKNILQRWREVKLGIICIFIVAWDAYGSRGDPVCVNFKGDGAVARRNGSINYESNSYTFDD